MLQNISTQLAGTKWVRGSDGVSWVAQGYPDTIQPAWPMCRELKRIFEDEYADGQGRVVYKHVAGVIASINELLGNALPNNFIVPSRDPDIDRRAINLATIAFSVSWFGGVGIDPLFPAKGSRELLRVAALYHDIGQLISMDRHVSRGVHLMRDVSETNRMEVEVLFANTSDRRDFWALLGHHDVYGCLCTGEASLPALSDLAGWAQTGNSTHRIITSVAALATYLLWLNLADSDARFRDIKQLGGITAVEALRYLEDWETIFGFLTDEQHKPRLVKRGEFKTRLSQVASSPEMAIQRISRLIASAFRKEMGAIAPIQDIQTIVDETLQAGHGPRLERFCRRLAGFCKLDYALRFFYLLMRYELLQVDLLKRVDGSENGGFPDKVEPLSSFDANLGFTAIRKMTQKTCAIIDRIVEEYGHLVDSDKTSGIRIGVDMSGLMRPKETGWAICKSLEQTPAGALRWIADEIGIWLFGD